MRSQYTLLLHSMAVRGRLIEFLLFSFGRSDMELLQKEVELKSGDAEEKMKTITQVSQRGKVVTMHRCQVVMFSLFERQDGITE